MLTRLVNWIRAALDAWRDARARRLLPEPVSDHWLDSHVRERRADE